MHLLSAEVDTLKSLLSDGEGLDELSRKHFLSLYNVRNPRTALCIAMQGFCSVRAHQGIEKGLMCSHQRRMGEGAGRRLGGWSRARPLWEALQFCAFSLQLPQSPSFTQLFLRQFSKMPPEPRVKRAVLYIAASSLTVCLLGPFKDIYFFFPSWAASTNLFQIQIHI